MTDDERGRGILTSADRDFLRAESDEYSRQARHERQNAIEDRVRNAILDFSLLFEHMDPSDIAPIFGSERNHDDDEALRRGLQDLFAFLYGATRAFHPPFKGLVQIGVSRGARRYFDRDDRATVEIEQREQIDIDAIRSLIEDGEIDALTDREREWLLETYAEAGELPDVRESFDKTGDGRMVKKVQENSRKAESTDES